MWDLPRPGIEPVPCIGRQILNHGTTREVLWAHFLPAAAFCMTLVFLHLWLLWSSHCTPPLPQIQLLYGWSHVFLLDLASLLPVPWLCVASPPEPVGHSSLKCLPSIVSHPFHPCRHSVAKFVAPWTAAYQASLSFTVSQSLLTLMSVESVMLSNHLILCCPILLLASIFPSIRIHPEVKVRWSRSGVSDS